MTAWTHDRATIGVGATVGSGETVGSIETVGMDVGTLVGLGVGASEQFVTHDLTHSPKDEAGHAPTHAYGGE